MNTTQLECFMAVAEYLNFSKAAASVNISQPAVSHQISSLEDELGVKLFLRTNKSVQLTAEGAAFISDAASILKIAESSKQKLSDSKTIERMRIGIGCHNQAELDVIPPILRAMKEEYSDIYPMIQNLPFKSLDNMLDENKIQVMLALNDFGEPAHTGIFTPLCSCRFAFICSKSSSLAKYETIEKKQIKGNIIVIERHKCPDVLQRRYSSLPPAEYNHEFILADGYESAVAMVKAEVGSLIFPLLPNMRDNELAIIPISDVEPTCLGIYSRALNSSKISQDFIRTAVKLYKNYESKSDIQ